MKFFKKQPFIDYCWRFGFDGVHFVSPGLLQLTVFRHRRRSHEPAAVCQNAAARLVSGDRWYDHMPVLQELHWLPVRRRVNFKMATLVYLSLSGIVPAYLAADCQLVSDEGRRHLRSATSRTCVVRRTYSNYGDRCFAAAGPKLWNSLPTELRQADISFQRFNRLLDIFVRVLRSRRIVTNC